MTTIVARVMRRPKRHHQCSVSVVVARPDIASAGDRARAAHPASVSVARLYLRPKETRNSLARTGTSPPSPELQPVPAAEEDEHHGDDARADHPEGGVRPRHAELGEGVEVHAVDAGTGCSSGDGGLVP